MPLLKRSECLRIQIHNMSFTTHIALIIWILSKKDLKNRDKEDEFCRLIRDGSSKRNGIDGQSWVIILVLPLDLCLMINVHYFEGFLRCCTSYLLLLTWLTFHEICFMLLSEMSDLLRCSVKFIGAFNLLFWNRLDISRFIKRLDFFLLSEKEVLMSLPFISQVFPLNWLIV